MQFYLVKINQSRRMLVNHGCQMMMKVYWHYIMREYLWVKSPNNLQEQEALYKPD